MNLRVRTASRADTDAVVGVLASAFVDDPLVVAAVAGARDAGDARAALMAAVVRSALANGAVLVVEDDAGPVGVATVVDPARSRAHEVRRRLVDAVRFLRAARRVGGAGMRLLNAADLVGRRAAPRQPHHVLPALGVVAHRRGAGVGRTLVDAVTARASADPRSAGLRLETENRLNAERYVRWGFTLQSTEVVDAVTVFALFRPRAVGVR